MGSYGERVVGEYTGGWKMPEPLKGKLFCFECDEYESEDEEAEWCPRYRGFRKEDIKSACE